MANQPNDPNGPRKSQPSRYQEQTAQALSQMSAQERHLLFAQFVTPVTTIDMAARLSQKPAVTVAFPPCAAELLALIKTAQNDDVTKFFKDYFVFGRRHETFGEEPSGQSPDASLDPDLLKCATGSVILHTTPDSRPPSHWPSDCCICAPCLTLDGDRNRTPPGGTPAHLRRLFLGDVVWAFYFDRMGVHQIVGAILDAFAYNGRLPISNGSIDLTSFQDDVAALVLEVMVRQTKTGMSSTVRDRNGLFRTTTGWVTEAGRKLNLDTQINNGFNTLFHKFIFHALEFYRDKRLAIAIQGAVGGIAKPSVATLVTISNTIDVLKKRFEAFQYGRNYYNTLSAIVWTVAGLSVIRELRSTLGIPSAFDAPDEFVPAAYDLLVLKRPVTQGDANRFIVHRQCAENGRDLLLDMEVLNHADTSEGGELASWLTQVEGKVEAYRTAYQTMTGVDLSASATATIEQQA